MQRYKIKAARKTFDPESIDLEQDSITEEELEEELEEEVEEELEEDPVDTSDTLGTMTVNVSTIAKEWSN